MNPSILIEPKLLVHKISCRGVHCNPFLNFDIFEPTDFTGFAPLQFAHDLP